MSKLNLLSSAIVAVLLLFYCYKNFNIIEARRNVKKFDDIVQENPTFLAYGLRRIRRPLDGGAGGGQSSQHYGQQTSDTRDQLAVGLRATIADFVRDQYKKEEMRDLIINDDDHDDIINSTASENREFLQLPEKRMLKEDQQQQQQLKKFNYLISPISNQILLDEEGDLAKYSVSDSLSEKYHKVWRDYDLNQLASSSNYLECRAIRTSVELTKDIVDKTSGQLVVVGYCKGIVALNRCEGSCSSSVLPSIKSRNGFKKECRCCNESTFRRIQVRLRECYSTLNINRQIIGTGNDNNGDKLAVVAIADVQPANSYIDIEIEEPIDCRCRNCEAYL